MKLIECEKFQKTICARQRLQQQSQFEKALHSKSMAVLTQRCRLVQKQLRKIQLQRRIQLNQQETLDLNKICFCPTDTRGSNFQRQPKDSFELDEFIEKRRICLSQLKDTQLLKGRPILKRSRIRHEVEKLVHRYECPAAIHRHSKK